MDIRKIGNYWYTYYKADGKLITRATGTMCKSEAEMIDKALKKELQACSMTQGREA